MIQAAHRASARETKRQRRTWRLVGLALLLTACAGRVVAQRTYVAGRSGTQTGGLPSRVLAEARARCPTGFEVLETRTTTIGGVSVGDVIGGLIGAVLIGFGDIALKTVTRMDISLPRMGGGGPSTSTYSALAIRCTGKNREGERCGTDTHCASGLCRQGTCVKVENDCILFRHDESEEAPVARSPAAAHAAARAARDALRTTPARLDAIAAAESACPAPLKEMSAGLHIGEISNAIRTRLGYILIVRQK